MYQNVYLHKTTRGFEVLLQAMWRRANELRKAGEDTAAVPVLEAFWSSAEPTIQQYLDIEEYTVLSQIQAWKQHRDPVLSSLALRFLNRDGFRMISPPDPENELDPKFEEWEAKVHNLLREHGLENPEFFCLADKLKSKYRTPYLPEKEEDEQTSQNSIRVTTEDGQKPVEISDYLPRLKSVTMQVPDHVRYYVPTEIREAVRSLN